MIPLLAGHTDNRMVPQSWETTKNNTTIRWRILFFCLLLLLLHWCRSKQRHFTFPCFAYIFCFPPFPLLALFPCFWNLSSGSAGRSFRGEDTQEDRGVFAARQHSCSRSTCEGKSSPIAESVHFVVLCGPFPCVVLCGGMCSTKIHWVDTPWKIRPTAHARLSVVAWGSTGCTWPFAPGLCLFFLQEWEHPQKQEWASPPQMESLCSPINVWKWKVNEHPHLADKLRRFAPPVCSLPGLPERFWPSRQRKLHPCHLLSLNALSSRIQSKPSHWYQTWHQKNGCSSRWYSVTTNMVVSTELVLFSDIPRLVNDKSLQAADGATISQFKHEVRICKDFIFS